MTVAVRHHCENPACPGFEVLPGERFCLWCGASQTRLEVRLEARREGGWIPLDPPRLMQGQRPELRVVVRQEGKSASIRLTPGCFSSSVPWLGIEGPAEEIALQDDEERRFALARFKPPKEGPRESAILRVQADGHDAQVVLDVLPVPEFALEPTRAEIRLERDLDVRLPLAITLQRGLSTVLHPPQVSPPPARLEWASGVEFPLDLDADGRRTLHGELVIPGAQAQDLRDRVLFSIALECTGREDVPPRLDLETRVLATPELVVEPFGQDRFDWSVVRGITEGDLLKLTLTNGADARADRTPLEIARLEILPVGGGLELRHGGELFPCTLARGDRREISLGLRKGLEPGREHLFTLIFHTNEPRPRHLYLAVQVREPRVFSGWLAVDLGTTSTCAALVDDALRVEMVALEPEPHPGEGNGLRSAVRYNRLVENRKFEVGYVSWTGYLDHPRATVLASKRKAGDPDYRFEVVPVEEPSHRLLVPPTDVLEDLYSRVAERAAAFLARSGGKGSRMWEGDQLLPTRLILTHPSRFTQRQVAELKDAATRAFTRHLQELRPDLAVSSVELVQEPIAAALDFLHKPESHAPWHQKAGEDRVSYRVLVYDCGGGTTDLTLLEVNSSRKALHTETGALTPEEEDAALEDLAGLSEWPFLVGDAFMHELALRAEARVLEREPGARYPGAAPEEEADARANRMMLESFASSAGELISAAVLASRDRAAWDRLAASSKVSTRLSLRAARGAESLDVLVKSKEIFPDLEAMRRRVLDLAGERGLLARVRKGAYRYRIGVKVLGASGHPRFGGEEMTEAVRRLLRDRALEGARKEFPGAAVELPDEPGRVDFHQELSARRNRAALMMWAESVKIALAEGEPAGKAAAPASADRRRLEILREGQIERRPLEALVGNAWPALAEAEALLEDGLRQTIDIARALVARSRPGDPEVLLLTGRASKWPQVRAMLTRAFPASVVESPPERKECVVQGASRVHAGAAGAADQPGVMLGRLEGVNLSTCRLGISIHQGSSGQFREAIADGLPIPPDGLTGHVKVSFRSAGANRLCLMENAGRDDRMMLPDGTPNTDVREVCQFTFDIPEHVDEWGLDGVLTVRLLQNLGIEAELKLDGLDEPFRFGTDGGRLGRGY